MLQAQKMFRCPALTRTTQLLPMLSMKHQVAYCNLYFLSMTISRRLALMKTTFGAEPKRRRLAFDSSKDQCPISYWKGKKVVRCKKLASSVHFHAGRELTDDEKDGNAMNV